MFQFWLFHILFIKIVSGLSGGEYLFANESVGSPVVSTTSGKFAGFTIRQTNVWVGIPYAAPPIGALRWEKAQTYVMTNNDNSTVRNATNYGPSCVQIPSDSSVPGPFDEDCLYLNVWAPRTPSSKSTGYPVMLWIHGGALLEGSASSAIYDGLSWTNAAIQENNSFIMVSINYRLNIMGFFSQTILLDTNGQTIANQGITDQRMAMKWIRDNIEQFGGDKNSITIMGQSAGSQSVCIHLVSPLSAGLFHAGIMNSGTCDTLSFIRDKSFAYSAADNLAMIVGCNMTNSTQQLACLRAVNSTLLLSAIANISIPPSTSPPFKGLQKIGGDFPFSLIVDGTEIPVHPLKAFLTGTVNQVPILTGATHDEFLSRVLYEVYFDPPTSADDYLTRILSVLSYNNSEIQTLYAPNRFNGNYTQAFVTLLSQEIFICSARRTAGYMTGQPVYLYTYTHAPELYWLTLPTLTIWPGAYHVSDLFNLFQTLSGTLYGDNVFMPDELPLAKSVRRYWTNMITKHQPNDNISLTWPQYSSSTDQIIVLDKNMTIAKYIDIYPNCDLLSNVLVKVYGEYLDISATCAAGNICFIENSITTTTSTVKTSTSSASSNNYRYYCPLNIFILILFYIVLLF